MLFFSASFPFSCDVINAISRSCLTSNNQLLSKYPVTVEKVEMLVEFIEYGRRAMYRKWSYVMIK